MFVSTLAAFLLATSPLLPASPSPQAEETTNKDWSRLSHHALKLTTKRIYYNPSYVGLEYPNGDVPENTGVCTDMVIRSYRQMGVDLQKLVHEDMKANFSKYPKNWGLSRTDRNIDHRRVPNLRAFFKRQGASLPVTQNANDYKPGDLVTWMLPGNLPHIGIVSHERSIFGRPKIIHHIGGTPTHEDVLFNWDITGHYRYQP